VLLVSCCLSAAGVRFSVIRFPLGDWAFLTVGLPAKAGPRRGYRVPHARAATGVGAPSTPRTAVLLPVESSPQPAPAASQRPVLITPLQHSISRALPNEASTRVQAIHPSGLPLARSCPDGTGALGLSPELRTPAGKTPDDARQGGDRPSSTDLKQRSRHQPNLQSTRLLIYVRPRVARRAAGVRAGGGLGPAFRGGATLSIRLIRARASRPDHWV
jgi:hypothetical protein